MYVGLEAAASHIRRYDETLVPGLLRTKDYAFAVYHHRTEISFENRDRLVEIRLPRQSLLTRRLPAAPTLEVIIHEAALLRIVGSRETMAEQLRHPQQLGTTPLVSVRVLPHATGLHPLPLPGHSSCSASRPATGRLQSRRYRPGCMVESDDR
ncbi:DUF5753 domain-containing protein [Micromonospora sp. NPDC050397]|uniref:DUF5753 domain-containing protein n=1 Tax=Micromonospora sp. NPDC050397 TaxID=3364279 RepID=UPI00384D51A9